MKRIVVALVLASLPVAVWAEVPHEDEIKAAVKAGATGAVDGGKQAAQEIAKDPGTAKKHVRSSLRRLFRGAANGARKALSEKQASAAPSNAATADTPAR